MTKTPKILAALRESIEAAARMEHLDGYAKGRHALDLFIVRADIALAFNGPAEVISDLLLRRFVQPLLKGVIHDIYEIGQGRGARDGELVAIIHDAIALAHADGTARDAAIKDAVQKACEHLDAVISPANKWVEGVSDIVIKRVFAPIAEDLANEAADALADWSKPKKAAKKKAAPKE